MGLSWDRGKGRPQKTSRPSGVPRRFLPCQASHHEKFSSSFVGREGGASGCATSGLVTVWCQSGVPDACARDIVRSFAKLRLRARAGAGERTRMALLRPAIVTLLLLAGLISSRPAAAAFSPRVAVVLC